MTYYHIFETARGASAIAWNESGIVSLRLPERSVAASERSLLRRLPEAKPQSPTPEIARIVEAVQRYFSGERVDFTDAVLDLGPQDELFTRIYDAVRRIGWGETTTYGSLARQLGAGPEVARDVGQAMAKNPIPLIIPCHRVLAAGGKIGGFSAPGGSVTKARMLELEGVRTAPAQQSLAL